jgi:thiol-disulfide isomerase/thioredoxin
MLKRFAISLLLAIPVLVSAAPFSFTDLQGRTHTLEGHRGKWVLVNLWATWCAPCVLEMPELEALSRSRPDVVVLGLAIDGQNPERVRQFAKKLNVTYPVIAGSQQLAQQFRPRGFPTSVLYNPSGIRVLVKEGMITREEIEHVLDSGPSLITTMIR